MDIKELESVIRDLEKRVVALEKQLNNHMFGNDDETLNVVGYKSPFVAADHPFVPVAYDADLPEE